jgi:hypothetical protein
MKLTIILLTFLVITSVGTSSQGFLHSRDLIIFEIKNSRAALLDLFEHSDTTHKVPATELFLSAPSYHASEEILAEAIRLIRTQLIEFNYDLLDLMQARINGLKRNLKDGRILGLEKLTSSIELTDKAKATFAADITNVWLARLVVDRAGDALWQSLSKKDKVAAVIHYSLIPVVKDGSELRHFTSLVSNEKLEYIEGDYARILHDMINFD